MTALQWDQAGSKTFQAGLDRGVLYPKGKPGVAWNGLTQVTDSTSRAASSYYQDGVKFLETQTIGEFEGQLSAFSYPNEFERIQGVGHADFGGLYVHEQRSKEFDLCYRVKLGNDIQGLDLGYELHLLYNLRAIPDNVDYTTLGEDVDVTEFSWKLTSRPVEVPGYRPSSHIVLRSTEINPMYFPYLEQSFYGTASLPPMMSSTAELVQFLEIIAQFG